MIVLEIGSEFAAETSVQFHTDLSWLPCQRDWVLTFSGRTAIETALRNIPNKKKALLPAWCCQSMADPFLEQGAEVAFYPVEAGENGLRISLQIPEDCDVVLLCNYFGFTTEYPEEELIRFRQRGGVVIEDITHSLLSRQQHREESDFLVASLRKWGALLDGGFCGSKEKMPVKPAQTPEEAFLSLKQQAMTQKAAYLRGEKAAKEEYLSLFAESNNMLALQSADRLMSNQSQQILCEWDAERMRMIRRENAGVLYRELKDICGVHPLFPEEKMDCPLFVPVLVENNMRDALRRHLIENEIYCPVHWPAPEGAYSGVPEQELSLICDQRYTDSDMQCIAKCIRDFMKRS